MILRGIFLCRDLELKWLYEGQGANFIFPEDWERFQSIIPENERGNLIEAYGRRIHGDLGREGLAFVSHSYSISHPLYFNSLIEMIKAVKAWTQWEGRICQLRQEPLEEIGKYYSLESTIAFAQIENYYFLYHGFLPRDDHLINSKNLQKIAHLPVKIIQGRYDIVCPPISAYELHKALPKSDLQFVMAGHVPADKEMIEALVQATEKFKTIDEINSK